jgi:hypothetical protein
MPPQPSQVEQASSSLKLNLVITPFVWALFPEWSSAKTINMYHLHLAWLCFLFKFQKERDVVYIEKAAPEDIKKRPEISVADATENTKT